MAGKAVEAVNAMPGPGPTSPRLKWEVTGKFEMRSPSASTAGRKDDGTGVALARPNVFPSGRFYNYLIQISSLAGKTVKTRRNNISGL
jgi:hypothetical protein